MADSYMSYEFSYIESFYLQEYCSHRLVNNTKLCQKIEIMLLILKADFYTDRALYPLTIILIIIGTILNLFSLYYFLKMNKRNSQNIYLSVLSLSDTIDLHMNFTLPMLRKFRTFDTYFLNSTILCRLTGVLTEFFLIFPIWIVILITIECLLYIFWSIKHRSLYAQKRAKISLIILAIIVVLLSSYRLFDMKGIDQFSAFSLLACNGTNITIASIRNFNLIIWIIVPEFCTLIMSLIIIYSIKLRTKKSQRIPSKTHRLKYNQTTKTVLFISILILILHTPTGIIVIVNFVFGNTGEVLSIVMLVARKLTIILYQISLCCKFFIYNQTFRNFKGILQRPMFRVTQRTNSAELGQPCLEYLQDCSVHQKIHVDPPKQLFSYPGNQRTNRGYRPLTVIMIKKDDDTHVSLSRENK